jgi:hypothetical protein
MGSFFAKPLKVLPVRPVSPMPSISPRQWVNSVMPYDGQQYYDFACVDANGFGHMCSHQSHGNPVDCQFVKSDGSPRDAYGLFTPNGQIINYNVSN